ncbi:MAG: hypothetical protein JRG74_04255 [Deltaproteobacteria bacterium]|nr:hypothetical protein [Deltaproteobacteria bacterium]MBW1833399.1 hypothetical protein [Deltaproteobacteria bacterium]MBW2165325.1 hypothetical protein [Deltaproteobacteria bacterium]
MAEQIKTWNGKNILKIKSDPLREVKFKNSESEDANQDSPESLRKEIEPWLTALFQSEHLSLLMGTGITSAVHRLATITPEEKDGKAPQGMDKMNFFVFKKQMKRGQVYV